MATEEQKKQNLIRMYNIMVAGLAKGLWDNFGEASFAIANLYGRSLLEIMEKEMGLEISGEKPEDVLVEIGRLFEDEFGLCKSVDVKADEKGYRMLIPEYQGLFMEKKILDTGVPIPFTSPLIVIPLAALRKLGLKVKPTLSVRDDLNGVEINFEKVI